MEKCNCYHDENGKSECWGTRERDVCSCGGDETKCDFYPEKRASAQARKVIEEFRKNKEYTYEETKEQFLNILNSNGYIGLCESSDMKNVISALDKQIPMKVVKEENISLHPRCYFIILHRCPNCNHIIKEYENSWFSQLKNNYCDKCGQALLWE